MGPPEIERQRGRIMALRWYTIVVDSLDPQAQARWWAQVLDWALVFDTPEEAVIIPKDVPPGPLADLSSWKIGRAHV